MNQRSNSKIVVTGSFTFAMDPDELREMWGDEELTDQEVYDECLNSFNEDWDHWATLAEDRHVEAAWT